MHPADLASHRAQRQRQTHRALARAIRHAALHATPADLARLHRLADRVTAGELTADAAREQVAAIRRTQTRAA